MKGLICLMVLSVQSQEFDPVSLLQTKKASKDNLGSMIKTAAQNIEVQDVQDQPKVESFIANLQTFVQGGGLSSEEALLQRASRSGQMEPLVVAFADMSSPTQTALLEAGSAIFKVMPETQQIALAQHLAASKAMDSALTGKTTSKNFWDVDRGMQVKETETRNGHHYHKHTYRHNGRGGNAQTETVSQTGNVRHEHKTSHRFQNGQTETDTDTSSQSGNIKHTHGHDTYHSHNVNTGRTDTDTGTDTVSRTGNTVSSHSHETGHTETKGSTGTFTNTESNGVLSHHGTTHTKWNGETRTSR